MRWPWQTVAADEGGARWVVLDVESSGLDPQRDRLLAVAAVAVRAQPDKLLVTPGDSFEVVLRQPDLPADKANILVHGIGVGAQRGGIDAADALRDFVGYAGASPLVGFHVAFDRALIERALRAFAPGLSLPGPWLDLADLAPVLSPQTRAQALDEWLAAFSIGVARRHQAAADALATAELMQKLWPLARAQGATGIRRAARLAASRRWIG